MARSGDGAAFENAVTAGVSANLCDAVAGLIEQSDGLDIRLPEGDVGHALTALSNLDRDEHLFAKDIVAIDLRLPDRLVVQLSDDAAKAREEALKKKDPKKKVGDA